MTRGVVFKEANGNITLLTINADLSTSESSLSDFDDIYETMPEAGVDIVEVDEHETTGVVVLKSLCGMTFRTDEGLAPAREAIRQAAQHEPDKLKFMIENAEPIAI